MQPAYGGLLVFRKARMQEPTSDEELRGRLAAIDARLDAGRERMETIERSLKDNTAATLEGNRDVREVLEMIATVKGGIRVLGWIGGLARWTAAIVGAVMALYGAIYAITHHGAPPPKP